MFDDGDYFWILRVVDILLRKQKVIYNNIVSKNGGPNQVAFESINKRKLK